MYRAYGRERRRARLTIRTIVLPLIAGLALGSGAPAAGESLAVDSAEEVSAAGAGGGSVRPAEPGRLEGRVVDPSGAPIPGATVTATADPRRSSRETTALSGPDGPFGLELPAGSYVIRVELEGFGETAQRISLAAGQPTPREFVLDVMTVKDSIVVHAPPGYRIPEISSAPRRSLRSATCLNR